MSIPNLPNTSTDSLEAIFRQDDIIRETCEQIIKDFAGFGITIDTDSLPENRYHHIHHQISQQIYKLVHTHYTSLLSLLYRIDISEEDIYKTEKALPHLNHSEVLAHQIMVRELKKVITRRYYKQLDHGS